MARQTHLHRRGSVYYFRRRVPKDLLWAFDGAREITESLGTRNHGDALKAVRARSAEFDRHCDSLRRGVADGRVGTVRLASLTEGQIERMVQSWFARRDAERVRAHKLANAAPYEGSEGDVSAAPDFDEVEFCRGINDPRIAPALSGAALEILTENNVVLKASAHAARLPAGSPHRLSPTEDDAASPQFRVLLNLVRRALLEEIRRERSRAANDFSGRSFDAAFGAMPQDSVTMGELIVRYENDPERANLSGKTKMGYVVIFRLLSELIGPDRAVRTLTRDDCRRVRDALMKLPSNHTKRFPGMTVAAAIQHAVEAKLPALAPQTVNSYLQNLSALFRWAVKEEYMDRNPAEGLSVEVKRPKRRKSFNSAELAAIFRAPLYTGCVDDGKNYACPGSNRPRRGRFWVPLLALWTGMRLNECCQLMVSDVQDIDGVACIIISEDAEGGDEADLKRVKTAAGERFVPVHPELKAIGFMAYVDEMRQQANQRLFPDLLIGHNGYYSERFSKWFVGLIKKVGIDVPRMRFHTLRHCYRDALRSARIGRDAVRQLGGWAGSGTDDNYGDGLSAPELYDAISRVRYEGLDLSHLHVELSGQAET